MEVTTAWRCLVLLTHAHGDMLSVSGRRVARVQEARHTDTVLSLTQRAHIQRVKGFCTVRRGGAGAVGCGRVPDAAHGHSGQARPCVDHGRGRAHSHQVVGGWQEAAAAGRARGARHGRWAPLQAHAGLMANNKLVVHDIHSLLICWMLSAFLEPFIPAGQCCPVQLQVLHKRMQQPSWLCYFLGTSECWSRRVHCALWFDLFAA